MPESDADIVAITDDTIQITFTPQQDGFAFLSSASITEQTPDGQVKKHTVLPNTDTQTSYPLPQGDSFVQITIADGPKPEAGTLVFSVNRGADDVLWPSTLPLHKMPGAFTCFGKDKASE